MIDIAKDVSYSRRDGLLMICGKVCSDILMHQMSACPACTRISSKCLQTSVRSCHGSLMSVPHLLRNEKCSLNRSARVHALAMVIQTLSGRRYSIAQASLQQDGSMGGGTIVRGETSDARTALFEVVSLNFPAVFKARSMIAGEGRGRTELAQHQQGDC